MNKLKLNDIKDVVENAYVDTDTVDTDIDDADIIPYYDASESEKKQTLWSNIKVKLETYFNDKYLVRSHVGMVIHTTTLDTEVKVKEVYGGTTWIQLSGYMLRGATGSVTANHNANDGGADSVTVSSVASHNHTQNAHTHTQNAHTHTQDSHNHTQNSHTHTMNSNYTNSGSHTHQYKNGTLPEGVEYPAGNGTTTIPATTATNKAATATNKNATATNQNTTATNKANGANYTVNTLPKYKNVYIWERTA